MINNEWQINFIFQLFNFYQIIIEIIDCNDDEKYISNIDICKKKYENILFQFIFSIKSKSELFL